MDPMAANIRQLVYHHAISDTLHTQHRFKTEARIRLADYTTSPVLSMVRMVKRLLQERKSEDQEKKKIYPNTEHTLIPLKFQIRPRVINKKRTTKEEKRV